MHGYEPAPEVATIATAAWRSQKAPSVGVFFAEGGSLKINDGSPSVGRTAITAAAQEFMTGSPVRQLKTAIANVR